MYPQKQSGVLNRDEMEAGTPLERILQDGRLALPKRTLLDYASLLGRPYLGGVRKYDLRRLGVALPATIAYVVAVFAIFSAVLNYQINTQSSQRFLSLMGETDPNLQCLEVPLTVTETHQATLTGTWDTQLGYVLNQSYYQIDFNSATLTSSDYVSLMEVFRLYFKQLGAKYEKKLYVINLISMILADTAMHSTKSKTKGLELSTSVDPKYVFNGGVLNSFLVDKNGACVGKSSMYTSGSYDFSTAALGLNLPLHLDNTYLNNTWLPSTSSALSPSLLKNAPCASKFGGYLVDFFTEWQSQYRDGELDFKFDMRSFVAAVGCNLGIDKVTNYAKVYADPNFKSGNMEGIIGYVDPWYAEGMEPFWCLDKRHKKWGLTEHEGPPICFISSIGMRPTANLYYPTITQYYFDSDTYLGDYRRRPLVCTCKTGNKRCPTNRFILGFFFGIDTAMTKIADDDDFAHYMSTVRLLTVPFARRMQKFLVDDPDAGDVAAVLHASTVLIYSVEVADAPALADKPIQSFTDSTGQFHNNSWAQGKSYNELLASAWGELGCTNCSAMVFLVDGSRSLSRFGLELSELAAGGHAGSSGDALDEVGCRNIIYSRDAFDRMSATPPVALVYPYFECKKKFFPIFLEVFGSAVAATNFLTAITWVALGYLGIWALRSRLKQTSGQVLVSEDRKIVVAAAYEQVKTEALVAHLASCSRLNALCLDRLAQLESLVAKALPVDQIPPAETSEIREAAKHTDETLARWVRASRIESGRDAAEVGALVSTTVARFEQKAHESEEASTDGLDGRDCVPISGGGDVELAVQLAVARKSTLRWTTSPLGPSTDPVTNVRL